MERLLLKTNQRLELLSEVAGQLLAALASAGIARPSPEAPEAFNAVVGDFLTKAR